MVCRSFLPGGHEGEPEDGGTVTDGTQVVEGSLDRILTVFEKQLNKKCIRLKYI
jgi:hypothetical protein